MLDAAILALVLASIWAFLSEKGPFHDWAKAHPALGVIALVACPAILLLIFF
jgi:hypothetical protein